MQFELLENLLPSGWNIIPLKLLERDQMPYSILTIHPKGGIEALPNHIGPADPQIASKKILTFVRIAKVKNANLVVAPEYSCPWQAIRQAISQDILPSEGNLWVIGCESILLADVSQLKNDYPYVRWIFEQLNPIAKQTFLNPVCYIFWANDNGNKKLVITMQFKTSAMGGDVTHLERDYMIPGTKGYILRNNENSINLISLICADALVFNEQNLPGYLDKPYLVLHPQLNLNPRQRQFKAYRSDAFARNGRENYEYLCVNWAKNFVLPGAVSSDFGGSAYYIKRIDDIKEDDIVQNHHNGLYYTRGQDYYSHIYFMNYNEHVFYFQTTKIKQDGVSPSQRSFSGPMMLQLYSWDFSVDDWIQESNPDDGFDALCSSIESNITPLVGSSLSPINKERMILLSTGKINYPNKEWYKVENLSSFQVKEDEIVKRITVIQDPCEESQGWKNDLLNRFSDLKNLILSNSDLFPLQIMDLKDNNDLRYPIKLSRADGTLTDSYVHNLCRSDGSRPATAVYVGRSNISYVQRLYCELSNIMDETCARRISIWYRDCDGLIKYYPNRDTNDYSPEDGLPNSIAKEA